jgi:hypothetical protein
MVNIGLVLIILVVIAGIIWQLRSNHRRRPRTRIPPSQIIRYGPARQLETLRHNRKFWGVEIQSGICEASKPPPSRLPIVPRVSAPAPTWDCGNGASVIGVHNPTGERQSAISTITRTGAAAGNAARPTSGATGVGSGLSDGSDVQVSTFPNSRYAHPVLGLAITPWPVDSGALHFR